jgi:NAD(P) transhydrogenase subunit alpha
MIIGSIIENNSNETRTALTPDVVKKLTASGHTVYIQKNIGLKSFFDNQSYSFVKAKFLPPDEIYKKSDILLQIIPPKTEYLKSLSTHQIIISNFQNFDFKSHLINSHIIRLEQVPRISVAQSIDILSSQSTIRGYYASIYCLSHSPIIAQQLISASTSIKPAQALILGASIAGLQAAATFKRNGCAVTILDINKNNKDLASSVGASLKTAFSSNEIQEILKNINFIVGCAHLSNAQSAPIISSNDLQFMPHGGTIVDTTPNNIEYKTSNKYHFYRNLYFERLCPKTASILWSNNMLNLINTITTDTSSINLNIPYINSMILKPQPN